MRLLNRNKSRLKTILNITFIILAVGFFVVLFVFRGSMNSFVSRKMKEQSGEGIKKSVAQIVDSAFNYHKNGKGYTMTFLEFGATGCISCRKMEIVMNEVKEKYSQVVNVKFYNILLPENQDMMKYFGIAAIPTQVLMDSNGKEAFRHTGYFSFAELEKEFQKIKL
ncbi:MAG: thioredoxin family protein [Bacteroidales bacterium]|nr:thioredoxin family protein [Bacteroidales bacterium]